MFNITLFLNSSTTINIDVDRVNKYYFFHINKKVKDCFHLLFSSAKHVLTKWSHLTIQTTFPQPKKKNYSNHLSNQLFSFMIKWQVIIVSMAINLTIKYYNRTLNRFVIYLQRSIYQMLLMLTIDLVINLTFLVSRLTTIWIFLNNWFMMH